MINRWLTHVSVTFMKPERIAAEINTAAAPEIAESPINSNLWEISETIGSDVGFETSTRKGRADPMVTISHNAPANMNISTAASCHLRALGNNRRSLPRSAAIEPVPERVVPRGGLAG